MRIMEKKYEALHAFLEQRISSTNGYPIVEDLLDGFVRITDRYGYHVVLQIDGKTMNIYDADGNLIGINKSKNNLKDASINDYQWMASM